jgi:hypothetical protein
VEISARGGRGGQVARGAAAADAVRTNGGAVGTTPRRARGEGDCSGGLGRLVASWAGLTQG